MRHDSRQRGILSMTRRTAFTLIELLVVIAMSCCAKSLWRLAVVLACWHLFAAQVPGHDLGVECKLEGQTVAVEAFFDDDTPCRNAAVKVQDADKVTVAEGRLDDAGRWSFPRPKPGHFWIVV